MRTYIIIFICILSNSIQAQIDVKYILEENFKDNKNSWKLSSKKEFTTKIKGGKLYLNNKTKYFKKISIKTDLNLKKDFKIETSIRLINGTNNNLLSLIFNKDEKTKNYDSYEKFGFADNGYWKYEKQIKFKKEENTGWLKTSHIKSKEFNILTVLKIEDKIFFLINNKPVLEKNNLDFFDKEMAIEICNNAEVTVNYLKIGYLTNKNSQLENVSKSLHKEILAAKNLNKNVLITNTVNKELQTSFDNNEFGFYLNETEKYKFSITNSALHLENTSKSFYQTWAEIKINPNLNFDISASLKRVSGTENKGISLLLKDKIKLLQFAYSQNGYWFSNIKKDGKEINNSKWQKTNLIKKEENNTLRIKKIRNNVYYILNDKVLNKVATTIIGNTIYFKIPDSTKVRVDDLTLTQSFDSYKKQQKLIAKYDKLWNDAKKENIGAFGKTEEVIAENKKKEEKYRKKKNKEVKRLNKIFKGMPLSQVLKKYGSPYKSNSISISYKYKDYYNGRKQELTFVHLPYQKGNLKYRRIDYVTINYKN